MSGLWPQLLLIAVLVFVNAGFSGTEMALISLREGQLQRLEQAVLDRRGGAWPATPTNSWPPSRSASPWPGSWPRPLRPCRCPQPLERQLDFLGAWARPVSIVVVTLLLAYATLVLGELAPKRVAMQRAERWALLAARPLSFMSKVTRPVVWLLSRSTDVAVRLMGGDPNVHEQVTEAERGRWSVPRPRSPPSSA